VVGPSACSSRVAPNFTPSCFLLRLAAAGFGLRGGADGGRFDAGRAAAEANRRPVPSRDDDSFDVSRAAYQKLRIQVQLSW
jgi:hypothetical protein